LKVLLDTNALMMPEQFGVDIFSELERLGYFDYIVPTAVVRELRAIAKLAEKEETSALQMSHWPPFQMQSRGCRWCGGRRPGEAGIRDRSRGAHRR
jgi:Uncharacterized proteins of PilT N-term./Vapc superfamily